MAYFYDVDNKTIALYDENLEHVSDISLKDYDITNKSWNEMPDLTANERQRSMLFVENNYLYCFMGLSQNGILDSIERINLENMDAGWENIIISK